MEINEIVVMDYLREEVHGAPLALLDFISVVRVY
jgi:hypothetical protein